MARQKSKWRKRLNTRWLRWMVLRAIFRVLPLSRRYSFPMAGVQATALARAVLDDAVTTETAPFTPGQEALILGPAAGNDKRRGGVRAATSAAFTRQVAIVPNCSVLGHTGIAVWGNDSAVLAPHGTYTPNWNFAKPKRLKERVFRDGLVTWVGGGHYYHFIERLLPLLGYLRREHKAGSPLTVLVPANGPPFQQEISAAVAAAFPGVTFVPLGAGEKAVVSDYLWLYQASQMAEWLPVTRESAAAFTQLLCRHYGLDAPQGGGHLFFSRGKAKLRRLTNEADLEKVASARGFTRFEAQSSNHREQVRQFANADVIVAVHGAGLTNLLFARPGTAVLEIFPNNFVKSTYLWLAARLGLEYRALIAGEGDYDQTFTVNRHAFEAALDGIPYITERGTS